MDVLINAKIEEIFPEFADQCPHLEFRNHLKQKSKLSPAELNMLEGKSKQEIAQFKFEKDVQDDNLRVYDWVYDWEDKLNECGVGGIIKIKDCFQCGCNGQEIRVRLDENDDIVNISNLYECMHSWDLPPLTEKFICILRHVRKMNIG